MTFYKKHIQLIKNIAVFMLLIGSLVVFMFVAMPPKAKAQQTGLTVSPALFEITTVPGQSRSQVIGLRNITAAAQPIKATVIPLQAASDTTYLKLPNAKSYDASRWITLDHSEFILQPGEERFVRLTIAPPEFAEPGGHYATILFTPQHADVNLANNTAYIASAVGSIAFVTVSGEIINTARLSSPDKPPKLLHFGPLKIGFNFENTGNVHTMPSGKYLITDYFGNQVAEQEIKPRVVLPGTSQPLNIQWGSMLMFNRYSIAPKVTFGAASQELTAAPLVFWVIPWGFVILAVVVLVLGIIAIHRAKHHWSRAWRALSGNLKSSD